MRGNDLDNQVVPRDILVWEGLLGLLPDEKIEMQEHKLRRKGKWKQAVDLYTMNELMARKVWDLMWRGAVDIELLTHRHRDFAVELEDRMEREGMPFRKVWYQQIEVLDRNIVYQPDIRTIYHPFVDRQFLYGGKGRVLLPDQHYLLGAL